MSAPTKLERAEAFVLEQFASVSPSARNGRPTLGRFRITCPLYASQDANCGRPEGISRAMVNRAIASLVAKGRLRAIGPVSSDYTRIVLVSALPAEPPEPEGTSQPPATPEPPLLDDADGTRTEEAE